MTKNKLNIGIELEFILNTKIKNFSLGEHGLGGNKIKGLSGFKSEEDSSLSGYEFNQYSKCVEIISKVLTSEKQFKKAMNDFKNFFSENGQHELNEVIVFNKSCGCHLHLSTDFKFSSKVYEDSLIKTRRKFFLELKKLPIREDLKLSIRAHYFRRYSQRFNFERRKRDRYHEFNFLSEIEKEQGLEYRSLNLNGVKTWKEFILLTDLFLNCCVFLIKCSGKYTKTEIVKIQNPEPNIKEIEIRNLNFNNSERSQTIFY